MRQQTGITARGVDEDNFGESLIYEFLNFLWFPSALHAIRHIYVRKHGSHRP